MFHGVPVSVHTDTVFIVVLALQPLEYYCSDSGAGVVVPLRLNHFPATCVGTASVTVDVLFPGADGQWKQLGTFLHTAGGSVDVDVPLLRATMLLRASCASVVPY